MDRKIIMGAAAVAGIALLLYSRKNSDSTSIGRTGSLVGNASAASNWASAPIIINSKAPATVADPVSYNTKPAPAPIPAPSTSAGGFSIGGGATNNPSKPGSGYIGAGGTEINDPTAVGRFDSIKGFINTLDWSDANKGASAAALRAARDQYGVDNREIAIASGYNLTDINKLLE